MEIGMMRCEALEIAKENYKKHTAADIAHMFHDGPEFDALAEFGYHHGWYRVGEYNFSVDDITGIPYDITQGGWAYL